MDAVDHNGAAQEIFWVKHALPLCILCVQDGGVAQPRAPQLCSVELFTVF